MKMFMKIMGMMTVIALLLCGCTDSAPADSGNESTPNSTAAQTGNHSEPAQPQETTLPSDPVDDGKREYTVTVVDQNGNPVAGVKVQFCDENNTCQLPVSTNAEGVVVKTLPEMNYHVTITLPEGYSCETNEFEMVGITELIVTVTAS